jgi:hypothetical protein
MEENHMTVIAQGVLPLAAAAEQLQQPLSEPCTILVGCH